MQACWLLVARNRTKLSCSDVTIEPGSSTLLPIITPVIVNPGAMTQVAVKNVLGWIHYDAHMPGPDHQVSRLRTRHPQEIVSSGVKIGRACVLVRKSRPGIDRLNQMRAITLMACPDVGIERGRNHRQPFVRAQCTRSRKTA